METRNLTVCPVCGGPVTYYEEYEATVANDIVDGEYLLPRNEREVDAAKPSEQYLLCIDCGHRRTVKVLTNVTDGRMRISLSSRQEAEDKALSDYKAAGITPEIATVIVHRLAYEYPGTYHTSLNALVQLAGPDNVKDAGLVYCDKCSKPVWPFEARFCNSEDMTCSLCTTDATRTRLQKWLARLRER